jgi:hypothetical protein
MLTTQRILYRARVLTENWLAKNAFGIGMASGATLTILVILGH